ncbi:transglycosylase domain-containing protein [Paludifilum halophilum]|uniref:Uncharacterized protein n=1 Tax=Paludifilum halophilum TaxID=1642702 RepID=A0A235B9Q4_9BACL|nr:transglycosylase domain-containing protein [Paludifilum halophilum]OYD08996.1 hypothetical protein CHM34_04270 [Paludifilum halophilum]
MKSGGGKRNRSVWKRWGRRGIKTVFLCLLILLTMGMGAAGTLGGYFLSIAKKEPIRSHGDLTRQLNGWTQTSHAYFRDSSPIGSMRTEADRKLIRLDELNPRLIEALVATEDKDFFHHRGIAPRAILRAAYQFSARTPSVSGGSTITQQLVKNTILQNRDKELKRKAREILLALRMERLFSKEEILTYYLNSLFFGKGAHRRNLLGVQAAAKGIFGVEARDLNLAQSAYLAGMIQRPNAYSPFDDESLQAGKKRMRTVLKRMRDNRYISAEEFQEALAFDLQPTLAEGAPSAYRRHPFVMSAVEEEAARALMKAEGLNAAELSRQGLYRSTLEQYRKRILTGGYKIYTTLDPTLGDAINRAARNPHLYANPATYTVNDGSQKKVIKNAREEVGAVLMDVESGAVRAFVGGRDFNRGQTNHALNARRQPGSAIKPLLDYGPAIDQNGLTPASVLVDEPLEAEGNNQKTYKNQNGRYMGPVTAREALKRSLNIPAIKVLRRIGTDHAFRYLKRMEFPLHPRDGEASAIGGFTRGFTVEEMTSGYAMLANEGIYQKPYLIRKIVDSSDRTVYRHRFSGRRILSEDAAYLTTDMLRDVVKSGTGQRVGSRLRGYDLAGKTGTSQKGNDLWFIGYTPRMALGVWIGYDINHPLPDHRRAKQVFSRLFQAAARTDPGLFSTADRFREPPELEAVELCQVSGKKATDACRQAEETATEHLPPSMIPEDECDRHAVENIVRFNGERYRASPQTPPDMVFEEAGIRLSEEEDLFSYYKGTVLPSETDPRTGGGELQPPHVEASFHTRGISLSWDHTGQPGVVGYRVYRDQERVASLRLGEELTYIGTPGDYTVHAVDVDGRESAPSEKVRFFPSAGEKKRKKFLPF